MENSEKPAGGQQAKRRFDIHQRYHDYLQNVTTSLSVVAALIAAALLAIILNPPEVIFSATKWQDTTPACYQSPDSPDCHAWRRVYSVSAPVALLMELATLLVAVAVTLGQEWLEQALTLFTVSLWPMLLAIAAAVWLSCTHAAAIVSSILLVAFFIVSLLPLAPAVAVVAAKYRPASLRFALTPDVGVTLRTADVLHWAAAAKDTDALLLRCWKLVTLHALLSCRDPDKKGTGGLKGATALLVAAHFGFTEAVKVLLDAGADPDYCTPGVGFTALQAAAQQGELEIVHLLLEAGANPNILSGDGRSALDLSASYPCSKLLLSRGGENAMAATKRLALFLDSMLQNGGTVDSKADALRMLLLRMCQAGEHAVVRVLLPKLCSNEAWLNEAVQVTAEEQATTVVAAAAHDASVEVLHVLRQDGRFNPLSRGGDGNTPLFNAYIHNNFKAVAELADWQYGQTMLDKLVLLRLFCSRDGARVADLAEWGDLSAEQRAAVVASMLVHMQMREWDWQDAVSVMLDKVDDPNSMLNVAPGVWETALFAAAREGDVGIIRHLRKDSRVNPLLGNNVGFTPLDIAQRLNHYLVVGELEAWLGTAVSLWDVTSERTARLELMYDTLYLEPEGRAALAVDAVLHAIPIEVDLSEPVETTVPPFAPEGVSPLLAAVQAGRLAVVRVFEGSGRIDPTRGNSSGLTPLIAANRLGRADMIQFVHDWCDRHVQHLVHDVTVTIFAHVVK